MKTSEPHSAGAAGAPASASVSATDLAITTSGNPARAPRPTFTIACWLLAMIAFAQLISVGTALTVRQGMPSDSSITRVPRVSTPVGPIQPRSVEEIVKQYGNANLGSQEAAQPLRAMPQIQAQPARPQPVAPRRGPAFPAIADARVERLVQEARNLHLKGDMMRAMLKLDEAARIDPAEPAVIYQKGLLFEDMGIFPKAADQYQQIQQMGIKSGVYYRLAATKLTKGMDTWRARLNAIAIGPMKISQPQGPDKGKRARVTIPLLARPDKPIDVEKVEVQVHFYDKLTDGKIEKAAANSDFNRQWIGNRIDWREEGNEETLVVDYSLPQTDLVDDHLLGTRKFYGCVVELIYEGEIIDQQASPRRLNSIHGNKVQPIMPDMDPGPWLPSDDEGLLPSRSGYGDDPTAPPLPTR